MNERMRFTVNIDEAIRVVEARLTKLSKCIPPNLEDEAYNNGYLAALSNVKIGIITLENVAAHKELHEREKLEIIQTSIN